jgi:hypothetical protein
LKAESARAVDEQGEDKQPTHDIVSTPIASPARPQKRDSAMASGITIILTISIIVIGWWLLTDRD